MGIAIQTVGRRLRRRPAGTGLETGEPGQEGKVAPGRRIERGKQTEGSPIQGGRSRTPTGEPKDNGTARGGRSRGAKEFDGLKHGLLQLTDLAQGFGAGGLIELE